MDAMVIALTAWIIAKTGFATPDMPHIAFVPKNQMEHLFNATAEAPRETRANVAEAGNARGESGVQALYIRDIATIYLPETWRPVPLRDQSILLHELVHHVQRFNNVKPPCPNALERPAYELQAAWLREQGVVEPYEVIGTDLFTVMVLTACTSRDE